MDGLLAHRSEVGAACGERHDHNVTEGRVGEIYKASGGTAACGGHNANTVHTFQLQPHARPVLLKNLIRDQRRHSALPPFRCSGEYVLDVFFNMCVSFSTMFSALSPGRREKKK